MAKRGYSKATAGINKGIQIWRIEKLEVAEQDPKTYGTFFSGDCYIILNTKEEKTGKSWDLHYWLGKDCSKDEQGGVAFKAVELDDLLGGRPVQHREVQGYESQLFMSMFPKGVRYQDGGVASAFNVVDPNAYKARLLHLKGKRNVRVSQVELKTSSLNEGDVFILDLGLTLFQWNGSEANKYEKFKGLEMITVIKDKERGGKAKTIFLESGKANSDDELFWKTLGGKDGIKSAKAGGEDDDQKGPGGTVSLFRISDSTGSLQITSVAQGKLEKKMLDTTDVFLLDTGTEVYVWIGKGATKEERSKGMKYGQDYLTEQKRPNWTPLTRVAENAETPVFKSFFKVWEEPKSRTLEEKKAGKPVPRPPEVESLYKQVKAAEDKMVDDGKGKTEVWRIEDMDKKPVDPKDFGHFYAGDSYIVLYSYQINGKDAWIIYFWQGRDSSTDEKAASAIFAAEMDKALGGAPVQVRVVQNKEPNHFLQLFKGKMIVHEGGKASGFKNRNDKDSYDTDGVSLFHIKGTTELNTRGIQVPEKASSLNSGDCFALQTPNTVYVWQGRGSNAQEKKTAEVVAKILQEKRKLVKVDEGKEDAEFWKFLGGKGDYAEFKESAEELKPPRLFHCSSNAGYFHVEETFNFVQDDLISDDVMILDTFAEVFVWIGHDAMQREKDDALKLALEYVEKAPDGRPKETPVFRIEAGYEPPTFFCHFPGWDPKKAADFSDPYAKKLSELKGGKPGAAPAGATSPKGDQKDKGPVKVTADSIGFADPSKKSYTLDELKKSVPAGVDPSKKEMYLSDAEFNATFKMSKDEWTKAPDWKKKDAKKKAGLF